MTKSVAFAILFGIAVLGLTTSPAKALAIYSYTGNNYVNITDSTLPAGTYTTSMFVSGSFTVAAPLLSFPSPTDISALVLTYSFNDGRNAFTEANSDIVSFRIGTDTDGAPLAWFIDFNIPFSSPPLIDDLDFRMGTSLTSDAGNVFQCTTIYSNGECGAPADLASVLNDPGVWAVTTVSVPEPSTLLLFGVGLAGLAGFARRRRQG